MSDIKSTIRIEDGFTEPLQQLSKETLKATDSVNQLRDTVHECSESIKEDISSSAALEYKLHQSSNRGLELLQRTALTVAGNLKKSITNVIETTSFAKSKAIIQNGYNELRNTLNNKRKDFDVIAEKASRIGNKYSTIYNRSGGITGVTNASKAVLEDVKVVSGYLGKSLADKTASGIGDGLKKVSKTEGWQIAKDFGREFGSIAVVSIVQNLSLTFIDKMRDSIINVFQHARTAIQNSLDEIDVSNKLSSMWGKAGDKTRERMYALANDIGEDAGRISELAARAAYQGVGTKDFERMMRLSDKIGKLSLGETTESAANNLLSNIKSGHDAGSFAQMLGGGQRMERRLRRAGFERALNRGDVGKALEIAEKITEQAGLTDEKYKKATNSLSENYKKIENVVSNIRRKISAIYVEELAPAVEKVKNFVESESFKTAIVIVEKGVRIVGKLVSGFIQDLIDWLPKLGVLFGVGILAKSFLFIKNLGGILGLLGIMKGALVWILTRLGAKGVAGALASITKKQVAILAKEKAIAALKVAGPWLLAGAAIAGALKFAHHLFGQGKTFSEFLMGMLGAAWQLGINIAHNVFAFFDNIMKKPKLLYLKFLEGVQSLKRNIADLINYVTKAIAEAISDSPLGALLKKAGFEIDVSDSDFLKGISDSATAELEKITKEIQEIESLGVKYVDVMDGVREAYESNGESLKQMLKGLFGLNKQQADDEDEIKTNSGEIRRSMEQEEDLRWLKAFSDRQIMSAYNMNTSNSQNYYMNGLPPEAMAEQARFLGKKARPGRFAMAG